MRRNTMDYLTEINKISSTFHHFLKEDLIENRLKHLFLLSESELIFLSNLQITDMELIKPNLYVEVKVLEEFFILTIIYTYSEKRITIKNINSPTDLFTSPEVEALLLDLLLDSNVLKELFLLSK